MRSRAMESTIGSMACELLSSSSMRASIAFSFLSTALFGCPDSSLVTPPDAGRSEDDAGSCDVCEEGARRCGEEGVETCTLEGACLDWSEPSTCAGNERCEDGACVACGDPVGTFRGQSLEVDGEDRFYLLHVPASYSCATPMPLLLDFHGTAGDFAEEAYGLEPELELADEEGFLVARLRARPRSSAAGDIYQWDGNPGDLERNTAFALALLDDLGTRYAIDPARIYAAGFSSGTNMAMRLIERTEVRVAGYGLVGGGAWNPLAFPSFATEAPRIWAMTGHRDYMQTNFRPLMSDLAEAGFPAANLFVREADAGHELYGWHYREMWAWLDRGERPRDGELGPDWIRAPDAGTESLLEIALDVEGNPSVAASDGTIYRRESEGAFERVAHFAGGAGLTGICFAGENGLAVGEHLVARTMDGGETWEPLGPAPEFGTPMFGRSYLNAIGCASDGTLFGGGYWTGISTTTLGESWGAADMTALYGFSAQVAGIHAASSGTVLSVGYANYIGRRESGTSFTPISPPVSRDWYLDAAEAAGTWLVVGEAGTILRSTNDGRTFATVSSGTEDDLYAVAFGADDRAMAVGAHGAALYSTDGGRTWRDVGTGLDKALADVVFVDRGHALAVGEAGLVLEYHELRL
jgi:photosystem II stability/assembly factor-like uncharacterized protein/predicted esterase